MAERLEGNWEEQRRTGRFVVEPVSMDEENAWLASLGMVPMRAGEPISEWHDRAISKTEGDENG